MNIVVAGFGREGQASYEYWRSAGHHVMVADENPEVSVPDGVTALLGEGAFLRIDELAPDMVIRSAGVSPHTLQTAAKVWSATNEFFARCPAPIIGVTGTKGKGTTCSFIASILREAGRTVHLVGNIGTPALSVLADIRPGDLVVYELSSFQLWDIERSPHVAVVLTIEPDHLDVHKNFDEYVEAKANIARWQQTGDTIVYYAHNQYSRRIAAASSADHRREYPFELGVLAQHIVLPGAHNRENAAAAMAAVSEYVSERDVIARGLHAFTGLDHRLQFVTEKAGVRYYNDSIATTPGSAIAALRSFTSPKILILGGSSKGADFGPLIDELARTNVRRVILVGEEGKRLLSLCLQAGIVCDYVDGSMADIVMKARHYAQPGDVVILSPACASFGDFTNYQDRGDQFVAAVIGEPAE